jgi:hypothetical protein
LSGRLATLGNAWKRDALVAISKDGWDEDVASPEHGLPAIPALSGGVAAPRLDTARRRRPTANGIGVAFIAQKSLSHRFCCACFR